MTKRTRGLCGGSEGWRGRGPHLLLDTSLEQELPAGERHDGEDERHNAEHEQPEGRAAAGGNVLHQIRRHEPREEAGEREERAPREADALES
jgi:hypothetical protein